MTADACTLAAPSISGPLQCLYECPINEIPHARADVQESNLLARTPRYDSHGAHFMFPAMHAVC